MVVTVIQANVRHDVSPKNQQEYHFTSVKVQNKEKSLLGWITVDNKVCPSNKIVPGIRADVYFDLTNSKKVTAFEILGDKVDEATTHGVSCEEPPADDPLFDLT
ncbi:MAG: hypothetical protein J6K52_01825 [Clostridia bacterium]|nr:hypothetical protein [Clostridia bacterium]